MGPTRGPQFRKCQGCGKDYLITSKKCPYCGSGQLDTEEIVECSDCHGDNPASAKACIHCGAVFTNDIPEDPPKEGDREEADAGEEDADDGDASRYEALSEFAAAQANMASFGHFLSFLLAALGVCMSLVLAAKEGSAGILTFIPGAIGVAGAGLGWALCLNMKTASETAYLFMDIEENTRRSADLLEEFLKRNPAPSDKKGSV